MDYVSLGCCIRSAHVYTDWTVASFNVVSFRCFGWIVLDGNNIEGYRSTSREGIMILYTCEYDL